MPAFVSQRALVVSILLLALVALTPNCASKEERAQPDKEAATKQTQTQFDAQFNQLQARMSFDQVKSLLGAPNLRELKGQTETWHYGGAAPDLASARKVIFNDGQVTEFGADEKAQPVVQVVPAPTPGVNLEIGQACKLDKECKHHNCHFHTCSGVNNCSVLAGGVCATDTDCCASRCDFSICKSR